MPLRLRAAVTVPVPVSVCHWPAHCAPCDLIDVRAPRLGRARRGPLFYSALVPFRRIGGWCTALLFSCTRSRTLSFQMYTQSGVVHFYLLHICLRKQTQHAGQGLPNRKGSSSTARSGASVSYFLSVNARGVVRRTFVPS
jgi:hypothetical protein